MSIYKNGGKRVFDLTSAALLLVVLLPIVAIVALLVRLRLGSPVLFAQERPGLHGRPFRLLKFRTLTNEVDADGALLPDEMRMTALGSALRALSLDELPELINVVRGEMSLVGPRPLLMEYLPLYSPEQSRRHDERPGITGLAQVEGRNALSWEEKFRLDVQYVDTLSLAQDLRILMRTVLAVATRHGINQEGFATAQRFTGSPPR